MHHFRGLLALLLAAVTLAACGSPASEQATVASPTDVPAPPAAPATAAPAPTAAPATAAPAPPAAAQPSATAQATLTAPAQTAPAATAAGGIPQGRTAEGYVFLGSPDAPVTLTMYSDFL